MKLNQMFLLKFLQMTIVKRMLKEKKRKLLSEVVQKRKLTKLLLQREKLRLLILHQMNQSLKSLRQKMKNQKMNNKFRKAFQSEGFFLIDTFFKLKYLVSLTKEILNSQS